MSRSAGRRKKRKVSKPLVLTDLEKLDARFPGLATQARVLLDKGVPVPKVTEILRAQYPVPITESSVNSFRKRRWKPQRQKIEADFRALEVLFEKFGGNYGLDLAAFARVRDLLNKSDIKEANSVRLAVLKMRAQDLKEEEFLRKTGQLKPSQGAAEQESDPHAQERKVLRRIKEMAWVLLGLASLMEHRLREARRPEMGAAAQQVAVD